jgi:AraC-like DNA-binding protein
MTRSGYREWPIDLGGAVVWSHDASADERVSRILPDGCIDLIWSQGQIFVAGPDTAARSVRTPAGVAYVAVRFAPGQAPALLGVPADELCDAQPELDDLWPARGRRMAERISAAEHRPAAFAELVRAEFGRCEYRPDLLMREAARCLGRGQPVEEVAAAVGLSPRQLLRRSRHAFGYGPKTLARVLRLGRAVALVRLGTALAEVAVRAGYADQAHLTRDVRALAGVPPTGLWT